MGYNTVMTTFTASDGRHLADLSGLSLSEEEIENLKDYLEAITGYISRLDKLDVTGVEPTYQVTAGLANVWRDDEICQSDISREDLLNLAPNTQDGQVKVPKVL